MFVDSVHICFVPYTVPAVRTGLYTDSKRKRKGLGMRKKEATKATRPSSCEAGGTHSRWTCVMIP